MIVFFLFIPGCREETQENSLRVMFSPFRFILLYDRTCRLSSRDECRENAVHQEGSKH